MNKEESSISVALFFTFMIIVLWFALITGRYEQVILNMSFDKTNGRKLYSDELYANDEKKSKQYNYTAYEMNFIGEFRIEEDGSIDAPAENEFDVYYSKIFPNISSIYNPDKDERWILIILVIFNGCITVCLIILLINIILTDSLEQFGKFFKWYFIDLFFILMLNSLGYLNPFLSIVSYIAIYFLLIRIQIKDISVITIVLPIVIWHLIISFHTYGKLNSPTYFYFICKSCFIATFKVIAEIIIILVKNKPEISEYKFIELLKNKIN